jgi:flavin reductase (DIM6/NTAB) family NADH-FMN oxidoreductase RutF
LVEMIELTHEPTSVTGDDLRRAMGRFATGVTVVTTRDPDGAPVGTTANAVCSLSLDPPLALVCLARSSRTLAALRARRAFAINVLAAHHREVSAAFARSADPTAWERVEQREGRTGAPRIADAVAVVECVLDRLVDGGDHEIAIGRVIAAHADDARRDPLVFHAGRLTRLAAPAEPEAEPEPAPIECSLPTRRGGFRAVALAGRDREAVVALVHGDVRRGGAPLVAAHVGCVLGEAFGSTLCDCRAALDRSFDAILAEGAGVLIYAKPDGARADRCGADETLDAAAAAGLLRRLGTAELRLWTHPPGLAAALRRLGLHVRHDLPRVP